MAVAETLMHVLPLDRPYRVAPDGRGGAQARFGSVFARAVQRGLGTVIGVLIGTGLFAMLPFGVPVLMAIAVLSALMPIAIQRTYGMFAALERLTDAVTATVIQAEHGAPGPSQDGADQVVAAMEDVPAAVREQRPPPNRSLPDEEPLGGGVAELKVVRGVLAGPNPQAH